MAIYKVIEWVPRRWWIVEYRPGMGFTPIAGPFDTEKAAHFAASAREMEVE